MPENTDPVKVDPKPKSGRTGGKKTNIYCFLVGINEYKTFSNLDGCIKDLDTIEEWLHEHYQTQKKKNGNGHYNIPWDGYAELKIHRLQDADATVEGIIKNFNSFLADAGREDSVWFHYSGHGVETPTAEEFKHLDIGKDQSLMCHDYFENEAEGDFGGLLADKEIALLLHELTFKDEGAPHVLVTLDACQSGGGTRDGSPDVKTRGHQMEMDILNNTRSLDSYVGHNRFPKDEEGKLTIPPAPHVVISACKNSEKANETGAGGGFFTASLIEALRKVNGTINYADLQIHTRSVVHNHKNKQTPQLNVFGGTNAYTRFLEGTKDGSPNRYPVEFINRKWRIQLGAVHGIPANGSFEKVGTGAKEGVKVKIYPFGATTQDAPLATAGLLKNMVGPLDCGLEIEEGTLPRKDENGDPIIYFGVLDFLPAEQEFILFKGDTRVVDDFEKNHWNTFINPEGLNIMESNNIHFLKATDTDRPHTFEVDILDNNFKIKNLEEARPVPVDYAVTEELTSEEAAQNLLWDLIKIVKWKRLLQLENAHPESKLKDQIDFQIQMEGQQTVIEADEKEGSTHKKWIIKATKENAMDLGDEDEGDWLDFILKPQALIAERTDKNYYFYLLRLKKYGIEFGDEDKDRKEPYTNASDTVEFRTIEWGLDEGEDRDILYLKLIVTSEALDVSSLLQDKIGPEGHRGEARNASERGFQDWYAATITIDLNRGK